MTDKLIFRNDMLEYNYIPMGSRKKSFFISGVATKKNNFLKLEKKIQTKVWPLSSREEGG